MNTEYITKLIDLLERVHTTGEAILNQNQKKYIKNKLYKEIKNSLGK